MDCAKECPMTAAACNAWCGFMVDGRCRFCEPPETLEGMGLVPENPHEWYLRQLAELAE